MVIGIDISQIVYEGTGVARYVEELTKELIRKTTSHSFILFGVAFRKRSVFSAFYQSLTQEEKKKVQLVIFPIPLRFMEILWNRFHIIPVEWLTGKLDIFWSSDWIQPPLRYARGITTIHDLTIYRFPESFAKKIVDVHKRKLQLSKRECSFFLCDSEATKRDVQTYLEIPTHKLSVVYPGFTQ
jgi:hypothetical protein